MASLSSRRAIGSASPEENRFIIQAASNAPRNPRAQPDPVGQNGCEDSACTYNNNNNIVYTCTYDSNLSYGTVNISMKRKEVRQSRLIIYIIIH